VVIVDAGSGVSRTMRRFWQAADDLVLVTSTDPVAIIDTYAALKLLYTREPNQAVHVMINNGGDPLESAAVGDRLGEACRRFLALSLATTISVPPDPRLNHGRATESPLEQEGGRSPATERFDAWVESWLANRSTHAGAAHARGPLLKHDRHFTCPQQAWACHPRLA
jgi:flagellar biosynthesis protein FlhG